MLEVTLPAIKAAVERPPRHTGCRDRCGGSVPPPGARGLPPDRRWSSLSSTRRSYPTMVRDDPARTPIKGEGQIKPSLGGLDVGDIALPKATRPIGRRHFGQPVCRNLMGGTTLGRARPKTPLLSGAQTLLAHEPSNPILPRSARPVRANPSECAGSHRWRGFARNCCGSEAAASGRLGDAAPRTSADGRRSRSWRLPAPRPMRQHSLLRASRKANRAAASRPTRCCRLFLPGMNHELTRGCPLLRKRAPCPCAAGMFHCPAPGDGTGDR